MTATLPDAATTQAPTLVVADWSSRCSACGRGATTDETHHRTALGGRKPPRGCGARFEAVAVDRDATTEAGVQRIADRLGLPYVGRQT